MDYIELKCNLQSDELSLFRDLLVEELNQMGYESFEETDTGVNAFIPADKFDYQSLEKIHFYSEMKLGTLSYTYEKIPEKNWNAEWESNFEPVVIRDVVYIRATFHPSSPEMPYEIVIEPKMSFGTGHHETTSLMIAQMLDMNLEGKKVLDMGCGTGILSIFAEMRKASHVVAIDYDHWAYENAIENCTLNKAGRVTAILGDRSAIPPGLFDVVLANINRNILLDDMDAYADHLNPGGILLLSGIYLSDSEMIKSKASSLGLSFITLQEKNNWISMRFLKQSF